MYSLINVREYHGRSRNVNLLKADVTNKGILFEKNMLKYKFLKIMEAYGKQTLK